MAGAFRNQRGLGVTSLLQFSKMQAPQGFLVAEIKGLGSGVFAIWLMLGIVFAIWLMLGIGSLFYLVISL